MSESLSHTDFLKAVKFDDKGLVPAIAQDHQVDKLPGLAGKLEGVHCKFLSPGPEKGPGRKHQQEQAPVQVNHID